MIPLNYETVTEAVNKLQDRGYTSNFSVLAENECLVCHNTSVQISPNEFEIDEIYRFEGNTDSFCGFINKTQYERSGCKCLRNVF